MIGVYKLALDIILVCALFCVESEMVEICFGGNLVLWHALSMYP